ncbi:hypothetical protein [Hymenobacter crusticola]|uniref:hypothetical protein n=1 Tax=Hymenobacter crusticola TaxID=1770526 RepID=UPI0015C508DB|nr:hypothetical protein [Hymenobacter crusticola]
MFSPFRPLQAGDLVQLLAGGPCMTLALIEGTHALCLWQKGVVLSAIPFRLLG